MLLCGIEDLTPGTVVGASVIHPSRVDLELLRPGVTLDGKMIARLRDMRVMQIWIHHDATADLDHAMGVNLSIANRQVFQAVRDSFNSLSARTFFSGNIQTYRQVVMDLIVELISGKSLAGMTSQLLTDDQELFAHSANVAYLSLIAGLQLETYVVHERGSRDVAEARDMTRLGLGGDDARHREGGTACGTSKAACDSQRPHRWRIAEVVSGPRDGGVPDAQRHRRTGDDDQHDPASSSAV